MPKITVVLHNIRSTHNVGSIFRTAEGLGIERLVLSGYTPYPKLPDDPRLPHDSSKITAQIHKTALGAETLVPFEHYETYNEWRNSYSHPIVALEQSPRSILLGDFTPPDTLALLLGEEVHGIERDVLQTCNHIVEIPMKGRKESFNVSVAAGIALYALTT